MKIKLLRTVLITYFILVSQASAANIENNAAKYPLYLGVTGGYGWTTWEGLVPPLDKQNIAMTMSTPTEVTEGGALWGLLVGYEMNDYFAVETAYMHYPRARVAFDSESIFTFEHEGITHFTTETETVSLMGKIMLFIPHTSIRAYSSFGAAGVHRSDEVHDDWITSPTFGIGFNYNFTSHVMGEIGIIYAAGRGQSELSPVEDYFPFVYSSFLRLAYRL